MDSDDSQADIFATQPPKNKTEFKTSSAPVYSPYVYPWLVIFKWGGDIETPFNLFSVEDLVEGELDPKIISGILSTPSRIRPRDLSFFPDFSISIIAKVEKSKYNCCWTLYTLAKINLKKYFYFQLF